MKNPNNKTVPEGVMQGLRYLGLNSLYCGKWRKILKSCHDLDLGRTIAHCRTRPSYFHILKYIQISSS